MRRCFSLFFLVFMMLLGPVLHSPFHGSTERISQAEKQNESVHPGYSMTKPSKTCAPEQTSMDSNVITGSSISSGEKQADKPLQGRIICIDPGHQSVMRWKKVPVAPGATRMVRDFSIGTKGVDTGVFEYTVVLEVSQKLRTTLEEMGAQVVLTRERADEVVGNIERAQIANKANADAFILLHCDGSEFPEAKGISVLYPGDRYIDDSTLLEESLALSVSLLEGAVRATEANNRGLMERHDLVGFNYSRVPCALIEMGFMTNTEEDRLLNSESYQKKLVQGMVKGLFDYLKDR